MKLRNQEVPNDCSSIKSFKNLNPISRNRILRRQIRFWLIGILGMVMAIYSSSGATMVTLTVGFYFIYKALACVCALSARLLALRNIKNIVFSFWYQVFTFCRVMRNMWHYVCSDGQVNMWSWNPTKI